MSGHCLERIIGLAVNEARRVKLSALGSVSTVIVAYNGNGAATKARVADLDCIGSSKYAFQVITASQHGIFMRRTSQLQLADQGMQRCLTLSSITKPIALDPHIIADYVDKNKHTGRIT